MKIRDSSSFFFFLFSLGNSWFWTPHIEYTDYAYNITVSSLWVMTLSGLLTKSTRQCKILLILRIFFFDVTWKRDYKKCLNGTCIAGSAQYESTAIIFIHARSQLHVNQSRKSYAVRFSRKRAGHGLRNNHVDPVTAM